MRTVEYSETMVGDQLGMWSTARRSTLNCQTPQTGFEEIAARTAVGSTAFFSNGTFGPLRGIFC